MWRDGEGEWRCFEDRCPHRLVPLSEGRIESDGTLLCAYHAWRFDGTGRCTSIPQALNKTEMDTQISRPKACATAYPVQVRHGLIFVWPDASTPPPSHMTPVLTPEVDDPAFGGRIQTPPWNQRDLPYSWDMFFENVMDPAHVNVSHHGLVGSRYDENTHMTLTLTRDMECQGGFKHQVKRTFPSGSNNVELSENDWQPPSSLSIRSILKDGSRVILQLYAVPTVPGRCMHIGRQVLVKSPEGKLPPGLAFFALPMPDWVLHATASLFLHQDAVFLHHQQSIVQRALDEVGDQGDTAKWGSLMYMPNEVDKNVVALRTWLRRFSGGHVPYQGFDNQHKLEREFDKTKLFDVWNTHTKDCKVCKRAHTKLIKTQQVLKVLAAVVVAIGICLDTRVAVTKAVLAAATTATVGTTTGAVVAPALGTPWLFLGGLAVAALMLVASNVSYKLQRLMEVYEYEHADNNAKA